MESAIVSSIVRALQELKVATYDSVRSFDRTYSVDSYKSGLWSMEAKQQVRRRTFQTGKLERYVWFLPWYEEDANEKLQELEEAIVAHLQKMPATGSELRQYFRETFPLFHQIAYLALHAAVTSGRITRFQFTDGRWKTVYFPSDGRNLADLEERVIRYIDDNGFALTRDLSEALRISPQLAHVILAKLAYEIKTSRFTVAWNYLRNVPIFAYSKQGYEAKAVARYRELVQARAVTRRRDRLVDEYFSKFKGAASHLKADEPLAELARSYFERLVKSGFNKGREASIVAWSTFFLASKVLRQGITPGDIESYGRLRRETPSGAKSNKIVRKTLLLNTAKDVNDFLGLSAPDLYSRPTDYLEGIVGKMDLSEKLASSEGLTRREELLKETSAFILKIPSEALFGKRSESIAAAALYMTAYHLGIVECTQFRVAQASDVTDVTLRNTMQAIISAITKTRTNDDSGLDWVESLQTQNASMKAKGLLKYTDRTGKPQWGTAEEVSQWKIQDAFGTLFDRKEKTRDRGSS